MLCKYFCDPQTRKRVEASPVAPYLMGFADSMRAVGHPSAVILDRLRTAVHFGLWAGRAGVPLRCLDEAGVERFRRHLPKCRCPGPRPQRSRYADLAKKALRFLTYLRALGVAKSTAPFPDSGPVEQVLLIEFRTWMQQHRGVTPATLSIYGRIIVDAIGELGDDPARYDVAGLRAFVVDRAKRHGRSKAKLVMTAMRAFLRQLIATGKCRVGLEAAIPTIPRWRLSALPRYLTPSEVGRVIGACDGRTSVGARDRAIILLLCRLGLRAGDVAGLRFSDIDWDRATIRVAGKARQETQLPMPQDVGNAVLAYLRRGRPRFATEQVFLCRPAPWRPVTRSTVANIVRKAINGAGLVSPSYGAHVLRHSAAVGMLRQGATLEQIRLILRHRDPETTALYAKVDLALLRPLAQRWPSVTP